MQYKIIDHYLDKATCSHLINDGIKILNKENSQKIHTNRSVNDCTSLEFSKLYNNSKEWEELVNKFKSEQFLNYCFNELNIKNKNFKVKDFFFKNDLNTFEKKYKKLSSKSIQTLNTKSLLKFTLFRIYKNLNFYFYKLKNIFSKSKTLELLFDYSQAGNGYFREIHRDSDERMIVFLLYLNELDIEAKGGSLNIYEYNKLFSKNIEITPSKENCELINSIKPETGKLVIFLNNDTSFHSVSEIENSKTTRHFIYGAFTLINGENPHIKSKNKKTTDFYNYY